MRGDSSVLEAALAGPVPAADVGATDPPVAAFLGEARVAAFGRTLGLAFHLGAPQRLGAGGLGGINH